LADLAIACFHLARVFTHACASEQALPLLAEAQERFETFYGGKPDRATGSVLGLAPDVARKAEALHLVDRTSEALEAINEAVAIAERFEHGYCSAGLHRPRAPLWVLTRPRLRIRFAKPSESQRSRSRFR
jgi:hypothetical protein